jgi:hypothetical protein
VGESECKDVFDLDNLCTRFPEDFGTCIDSEYLEPEEFWASPCNSEDKLPKEFDILGDDTSIIRRPKLRTISLSFSDEDPESALKPKEARFSTTNFDDEPTPPASLVFTVDTLCLKTGVLEKKGLPLYPVLRGDSEPDSSDFAVCVSLRVLDFFPEAVSFEVLVLGATDPSLPSVCCDPEDNSTDSGFCTRSAENLKALLDFFL